MAHAFSPSTPDRGRQISEFKASLVYNVSSRTARAIQRNLVSKTTATTTTTTKQIKKQLRTLSALPEVLSSIQTTWWLTTICNGI